MTVRCGFAALGWGLCLLTPLLGLAACDGPTKPEIQELEASVPHGKIYVRVAGDRESGNVMIAIHGGPGQSHHYMLDLERLAGREFSVVTYD